MSTMNPVASVAFPAYSGIRCLMMPYVQGDVSSLPSWCEPYRDVLARLYLERGKIGYLTIDESPVTVGRPHRGAGAKHGRALHTEVGRSPGVDAAFGGWGSGGGWGSPRRESRFPGGYNVLIGREARVLLANSLDRSCALWDAEHYDTTPDGDIGHCADQYPYESAVMMRAGDVHEIGVFTPHESLPVERSGVRQFLRIIGGTVLGREPYFTENPLMQV